VSEPKGNVVANRKEEEVRDGWYWSPNLFSGDTFANTILIMEDNMFTFEQVLMSYGEQVGRLGRLLGLRPRLSDAYAGNYSIGIGFHNVELTPGMFSQFL
jgi:hypothetical protein